MQEHSWKYPESVVKNCGQLIAFLDHGPFINHQATAVYSIRDLDRRQFNEEGKTEITL